ncbi:MAG: hypothetical protein HKO56_08990 [Bacteroidia bacterium]|nr:hypothetical protein [Bacteroidia bacterium]NNM16781.1 hypothetical protein [Bacteroidia bacterium]
MAKASKHSILKHFDKDIVPKSILINAKHGIDNILAKQQEAEISFPLIAKPDVGERGKRVQLIEDMPSIKNYINQVKEDIILQEFIDLPIELGIMYYRYPNKSRGEISSIVKKEFLQITGDGKSTYKELFINGKRTKFYLKQLFKQYEGRLKEVPSKDEIIILQHIGNHNKGTTFLNGNDLINDKLVQVFDNISDQQKGFFFGRYDIKVNSIQELYRGEGIKIMELNGSNSEPAHIYDPKMSLWQAYKDLAKHWDVLYKISVMNNKNGIPYTPTFLALKEIIHYNLKKNPVIKPQKIV